MSITKILDPILLPIHLKYGLHLDEISDDFVVLENQYNKPIDYFTQHTTAEEIHKIADKWLRDNDLGQV